MAAMAIERNIIFFRPNLTIKNIIVHSMPNIMMKMVVMTMITMQKQEWYYLSYFLPKSEKYCANNVVTYLRGNQGEGRQRGRQHCTCSDPSPPAAEGYDRGLIVLMMVNALQWW